DDPPERGRLPDRERARPADRLRHRHSRRGVGRSGARRRARDRDGLGRGKSEEPRGPRQRRALPAHPPRPGAAAAHRARAALRARSRPGARDAHRPAAEGPQGGRRLISGVALVAKPAGPTSHDVVDTARRALGTRRIGHLGTPDPFAAGLLLLVAGRPPRPPPFPGGRATVGAGTYLRSLAREAGAALGCGAHLAALVRTRVGPFRLEDAVGPGAVTPADLRDPAALVADLPRGELDDAGRAAVIHGRPL